MANDISEGPIFVVGIQDPTEEFIRDISRLPNPTIAISEHSVWLDPLLEHMLSHFEFEATALDSYKDWLFKEDLRSIPIQPLERVADLESLFEYGKKVFKILQEAGLYSQEGELIGKYLNVHGQNTLVLCHYPQTSHWY